MGPDPLEGSKTPVGKGRVEIGCSQYRLLVRPYQHTVCKKVPVLKLAFAGLDPEFR